MNLRGKKKGKKGERVKVVKQEKGREVSSFLQYLLRAYCKTVKASLGCLHKGSGCPLSTGMQKFALSQRQTGRICLLTNLHNI